MKKETEPPDIEASRDRLKSLSPRHRKILGLVHEGLITKEIADRWQISDDRVNKLIGQACRILGGMPRQKAAHLVARYEASLAKTAKPEQLETGQPVGAQSIGLAQASEISPNPATNHGVDVRIAAEDVGHVQENHTAPKASFQLRQLIPIRTGKGANNELSISFTLIVIAVLTTAALLSAGAAASLLSALDAFLRR